jgi:MFS family permease
VYWTALGLAPSSALFFAAVALEMPCGPIAPYTRTVLSNSVPAAHQAQIFAAFSAIESIATLIAPIYSYIYGATVKSGASAVTFFVMALSAVASGAIATYVRSTPQLKSTLPDQSRHSEHSDYESKSLLSGDRDGLVPGRGKLGSFLLDDEAQAQEEIYAYDQLRRLDYPQP